MNETILRGICKKCEDEVIWRDDQKWELCSHSYSHIPVWFLSARQMRLILFSDEFEKWSESSDRGGTLLSIFLEKEPFLVSRILRDAGEKSKEENK